MRRIEDNSVINYRFRDKTLERMNQKSYPREKLPAGQTSQLPIEGNLVLYRGLLNARVVRKFKKEEPEGFLAVRTLLRDEDFLKAKSVLVRENDFGYIPVLLASKTDKISFTVSTPMSDKTPTLDRNIRTNLVEGRVETRVDGLDLGTNKFDTAILVHEQHTNPDTLLHELSSLSAISESGDIYLVSHKKKGADSLLNKAKSKLGVSIVNVVKGLGGVRVAKLHAGEKFRPLPVPIHSFNYSPKEGLSLTLETTPSLFSAEKVDDGSDFLIRHVLKSTDPSKEISIYDLACGYGAIGLSLASSLPKATVVMSDTDARAVEMTERNVNSMDLKGRVTALLSDGPDQVQGRFDLVVFNPPLHTEKSKLIDMIKKTRGLVKKKGKMLLIVEDSRAKELVELLSLHVGYVRKRDEIPSYVILEIAK